MWVCAAEHLFLTSCLAPLPLQLLGDFLMTFHFKLSCDPSITKVKSAAHLSFSSRALQLMFFLLPETLSETDKSLLQQRSCILLKSLIYHSQMVIPVSHRAVVKLPHSQIPTTHPTPPPVDRRNTATNVLMATFVHFSPPKRHEF